MLHRRRALVFASLFLAACSQGAPPSPGARAEVRNVGGQLAIVPTAGQLPFCLVVEAPRGHAQAYPLAADGQSVPCEAGKPIGDRTWPIPATDDAIRTFVVFSDRKLKADTVVLQIGERLAEGPNATVTSMDLRAPGRVALETLEIKPAEVRLAK